MSFPSSHPLGALLALSAGETTDRLHKLVDELRADVRHAKDPIATLITVKEIRAWLNGIETDLNELVRRTRRAQDGEPW